MGSILVQLLEQGVGIWKQNNSLVIESFQNHLNTEKINYINSHKDELFAFLEADKKYYPLSFSEEVMCLQTEFFKNLSYQLAIPLFINRTIKKEILIDCMNEIIDRHTVLRTIFSKIAHHWIQIVLPKLPITIDEIDLSPLSPEDQKTEISDLLNKEKKMVLSINHPPLFRLSLIKLSNNRHVLLLNIHHAIFDGFSFFIFLDELMKLYNSKENGVALSLPTLRAIYPHFVLEQKGLASVIKNKEIAWWKDQLHELPLQIEFGDQPTLLDQEENEVLSYEFTKEEALNYESFCKTQNISMNILFLTGLAILINRWTLANDFIIGTVLNQRTRVEYENLMGDFNNIIPFRIKLSELTGIELLKYIQNLFFEVYSHQKVTFNELLNELKIKRSKHHSLLYNIFFDSLNLNAFQKKLPSMVELPTAENIDFRLVPLMDVFFFLLQREHELLLLCTFNKRIFEKTTIKNKFIELNEILTKLVQDPEARISLPSNPKDQMNHRKPSLFCLPGMDGQIEIFSRLTAGIKEYETYAIKYKGMEGSAPFTLISEISTNVSSVIQKANPTSHSCLIGLSIGGIVMLDLLKNSEYAHLFSDLILLDTPPLLPYQEFLGGRENPEDKLLILLLRYFEKTFEVPPLENASEKLISLNGDEKNRLIYNHIKSTFKLLSFDHFKRLTNLMTANLKALSKYPLQPNLGKYNISYIAASSDEHPLSILIPGEKSTRLNKKEYWQALFPNCIIQYYEVPNTNHFSLFTKEKIKAVQELINLILKKEK